MAKFKTDNAPLLQVVSDSQIGPDNSDLNHSVEVIDEIPIRSRLKKLEIQLQKQEALNTHFANQIQSSKELIQSSIQDFQSSLQLIFQELNDLKKSMKLEDSNRIRSDLLSNFGLMPRSGSCYGAPAENHQNENTSSGIFGSAPVSVNTPSTKAAKVISQESVGMLHNLSGGAWDPHDQNSVAAILDSSLQCWDLRSMKKSNSIEHALVRDLGYNPKKQHILVTAENENFGTAAITTSDLNQILDQVLDEMHYRYIMAESLKLDDITNFFVFDPGGDTFDVYTWSALVKTTTFDNNNHEEHEAVMGIPPVRKNLINSDMQLYESGARKLIIAERLNPFGCTLETNSPATAYDFALKNLMPQLEQSLTGSRIITYDWQYGANQFVKTLPKKVVVHCSERNIHGLTLDGIDVMGERLAEEVVEVISRRPGLKKISFIAYSLGGLVARWFKLIQKPFEEGDERGLKLVQSVLRQIMLRRTKSSTDKDGRPILDLPPANVEVIYCVMTEAEKDFYEALFKRSKVKFDQFVEQGRVLHNYASILELLLRLRQCCDHLFLVMSRGDTKEFADLNKLAKRFLKGGKDMCAGKDSNVVLSEAYIKEVVKELSTGGESECPVCLEAFEDAVLTPCAHRLCRECLLSSWRNATTGLCPVCRNVISRQELITAPSNNRFQVDVEKNGVDSCKISILLQELKNLHTTGSKSIVFSQWTAFLDLLQIPRSQNKITFLRLDGTLNQQQREKVIKEFTENSGIQMVFLEDAVILLEEVANAYSLVKAGSPNKVDWAGLVWSLIEKEIPGVPNRGCCYYASHLQRLTKFQKPGLFKEVEISNKSYTSCSNSGSSTERYELSYYIFY